jgi:hypothetical protein
VRLYGLDNLFCDQTAVGREGILYCFVKVVLFFIKERYCFFYQIEAEKRFSSVEIEVVAIRQKRQKKTKAFLAVADVMQSLLLCL